jgi:hypothetical protein
MNAKQTKPAETPRVMLTLTFRVQGRFTRWGRRAPAHERSVQKFVPVESCLSIAAKAVQNPKCVAARVRLENERASTAWRWYCEASPFAGR